MPTTMNTHTLYTPIFTFTTSIISIYTPKTRDLSPTYTSMCTKGDGTHTRTRQTCITGTNIRKRVLRYNGKLAAIKLRICSTTPPDKQS